MKYLYILSLFFLCYSTDSLAQEKSITVGSGGGVAGTATVFKIFPNGKVFRGKGMGEIKYTECAKIKKAHALKYLQSTAEQTQSTPAFNHPGNLYFFIGSTENNSERKVTWGDGTHPVPESIQKLYQEINAEINTVHFKPIK